MSEKDSTRVTGQPAPPAQPTCWVKCPKCGQGVAIWTASGVCKCGAFVCYDGTELLTAGEADHSRRAEMPPQPIPSNPEHGGHSWTVHKGLPVCGICGIVKRADGTNKPCKGPVFIQPRRKWEGTNVPKNAVSIYDNEPKVASCPKCLRPVLGCGCNDMVAWVLEINGKCLARWGDDTLHAEFTDPNALRFSRRQDAEWALCVLRATGRLRKGEYPLPVEHVWSSPNETQQEHGCNAPSGEGIADRDPATPRFFHDHRRSTDNPGEKTIHIRQTERTQASPEPRPAPPPLNQFVVRCEACKGSWIEGAVSQEFLAAHMQQCPAAKGITGSNSPATQRGEDAS